MRSDARANRDAIVTAARGLFAAKGLTVPMSAIADAAGTGIATLYRNFPTREDVVRAVVLNLTDQFSEIGARYQDRLEEDPQNAWRSLVVELAKLQPGALLPELLETFTVEGAPDYLSPAVDQVNDSLERLLAQVKTLGLVRADITAVQFQLALAAITRPMTATSAVSIRDTKGTCPAGEAPASSATSTDPSAQAMAGHECLTDTTWLVDLLLRGLRPDPEADSA